MRTLRSAVPLLCAVFLGACGGDMADLDSYMKEVKARPRPPLEPIPTFKPYKSFSYSAQSLRSPFEIPLDSRQVANVLSGREVKPDLMRPREFLERFTFEALAMVGTLEQSGTLWALMSDGEGGVHRVRIGNFLGKNHGRIVATSETAVEVREIVSNGVGGWIERPRTIKLTER